MTQNRRNQLSEGRENSGRGGTGSGDQQRFDGFEDMNYEQVRQPYNPKHIRNRMGDERSGGTNEEERHEEL
jgi:hypothetical protein